MLTKRRQIAAKIESVEGTAETLAAADATLLVFNPSVGLPFEMAERAPAKRANRKG